MIVFKNKFPHILFIIIPLLCYLGFILVLKVFDILSLRDVVNNLAIFIGWIVALSIVWIQLKKTREDNQILKREEIKKSLEINAFREINKAVTNFSEILSTVSTRYLTLPGDLERHIESPDNFRFNRTKIELEINEHRVKLCKGVAEYVLSIEANETAVTKFDHLRKYIQFKVDDVNDLIWNFQSYLSDINTSELKTNRRPEFNEWCRKIRNELSIFGSYLFDYRKELMNYFLGEIFLSKVPRRKPRDPQYKILTEVAIKEDVEKEAEKRERKALGGANVMPSKEFEIHAREFLSKHWNTELEERQVKIGDAFRRFDMVSKDESIIGDAKFMKNIPVPAAKWSDISECVWLLQKTKAKRKFIVFGQDREIPERYLKRWSSIVKDIEFYFFDGKRLERLN